MKTWLRRSLWGVGVVLLVLVGFGWLGASSKRAKGAHPAGHEVQVVERTVTPRLFYTSRMATVDPHLLTSPADGHVLKWLVPLGHQVRAGQVVVYLKSTQLGNAFVAHTVAFWQAKDAYQKAKRDLAAKEALWKAGIVSDQEHDQAKTNVDVSYVTYLKDSLKLKETASIVGEDAKHLMNMTLSDLKSVKKVLQSHRRAQVVAEHDGVLLSANNAQQSNGQHGAPMAAGSKVTKGSVLALVASRHGIRLPLQVDESDINRVNVGDTVLVKGAAFPGATLKGVVRSVDTFNPLSQDGQGVSFPVMAEVTNLPKALQGKVHLGMRADVTLVLPTQHVLACPMDAVFQDGSGTWVRKVMPDGSHKNVQVQTGDTDGDWVAIRSGLSVGDRLWVVPRD